MIKDLNTTLSVITLIILLFFSMKICFGTMFASDKKSSLKETFRYLRKYNDNIDD